MRPYLLLLAIGVGALAWGGDSKMTVSSASIKGSVVITNRVTGNGGKYVRSSMRLTQSDGRKVHIIQESTFDKDGNPLRKSQTTTSDGNTTEQTVVVDFDSSGASVKAAVGKQSLETKVPYPEGKSTKCASEFWVFRDKPKPGASVTYWRFDLGKQDWVETPCTYLGKRKIKVNGKSLLLHCMKLGEVMSYTDDIGDPVMVETESIKMTRTK